LPERRSAGASTKPSCLLRPEIATRLATLEMARVELRPPTIDGAGPLKAAQPGAVAARHSAPRTARRSIPVPASCRKILASFEDSQPVMHLFVRKNMRFERTPRGRTSKHTDTLRILELLGTQTVRATIEDGDAVNEPRIKFLGRTKRVLGKKVQHIYKGLKRRA
jgi:hypothetical protein